MDFALNRLDMSSSSAFAASARRIEQLGWHYGLLPCNPLKVPDPYVSLTLAAQATSTIALGTLLDTPVVRHPAVIAGSIATVAEHAPERIHLGLGIGDTAVRFNALTPATVDELEQATVMVRELLAGQALEIGAARPARLNHARPVPVWIAAQGPKTLAMAGRVADGVWIRVGTHPANLIAAWQAVCAGATEAGRDPRSIRLGLIFHTAFCVDLDVARTIGKSLAAGYYEYSKFLFEAPGIAWTGEDPEELRAQVYPDFHHHRDMERAGKFVDFLPDAAADAFALHGDWPQINRQLDAILGLGLPVDVVLPHPVLPAGSDVDYAADAARHLLANWQ